MNSGYLDVGNTDCHHPWQPWIGSDLIANPPFIDAKRVTRGENRALASIDGHLLKEQVLEHCMSRKGLVIIKNIELADTANEDSKNLCEIFSEGFKLYPQERDGKLVLDLAAKREQPGWLEAQPLHTDAGHFLGLLCRGNADTGGESILASTLRLHDILADEAPEVLRECFSPWKFHRKNRPGPPYYEWPIFRYDNDFGLSCYYLPNTIRDTPAFTGRDLSPAQFKALDKLDEVLEREEIRWTHKLERGDLLILNNKKLLHARAGYLNDPGCARSLLRVWINLPESELSHDTPRY